MKLQNKLEIQETLQVGLLPNASTSNFSVLFESGGLFHKRVVGSIINRSETDYLPYVSNSFPNIFNVNASTTNANPNLVVSFVNQLAGTVFAAPQNFNGTPTFRMLQDTDLSQTSLGNKQVQLVNGLHTILNTNKIDVAFENNVWIKDKAGKERFYFGNGGSTTDDTYFKRGYLGGEFWFLDSDDSPLMKIGGGGVMRIYQLAGSGNRLLQADLSGSIFATNIDPDDIATETWVDTNFARKTGNYQGLIVGNSTMWNGELYNQGNIVSPTDFLTHNGSGWGYTTIANVKNALDFGTDFAYRNGGTNITNPATWRTNLDVYSTTQVDGFLAGKANTDATNLTNITNWQSVLGIGNTISDRNKKRNYFLNSAAYGASIYRIYLPSNTVSDVIIRVNSSYHNAPGIGIIEMQLVYGVNLGSPWGMFFKCTDVFGWVKDNFYVEPTLHYDAVKDRNYVNVHKYASAVNPYFIDVEIRNNQNDLTDDSVFFELDTTTPVISNVNITYDDETFVKLGDNISLLNNDVGYITSGALANYVSKAGDTMTGSLTINVPNNHIQLSENNNANWHIESVSSVFNIVETGVAQRFRIIKGALTAQFNGFDMWHAGNFNPANYALVSSLANYVDVTTQSQQIYSHKIFNSQGNIYSQNGIELKGDGSALFPGIGFHQPGIKGSSLQMRNDQLLYFDGEVLATRNWTVNNFASNASLGNYVSKAGDTMQGSLLFPDNIRVIYGTASNFIQEYNDFYGGLNIGIPSVADGLIFVKNNGNVGIGNFNPQAKLHVNGNVIANDAVANNHLVTLGQLGNYATISALNNKANIDGSNTVGGTNWDIQRILSSNLTNISGNGQIFHQVNNSIFWGNPQLSVHTIEMATNNGLLVYSSQAATSGEIWHVFNFNPATKANYDGSNLTNIANWRTVLSVPTNNNQLANGAGYITSANLAGYALISQVPTNNNQLTNGANYTTLSLVQSWINSQGLANTSIGVNGGTATNGVFTFIQGTNMTITRFGNNITFNASGGGGGVTNIATDDPNMPGPTSSNMPIAFYSHVAYGKPETDINDEEVGNGQIRVESGDVVRFHHSFDNVMTFVEDAGKQIDIDTNEIRKHIINAVFTPAPGSGGIVTFTPGVYTGDQINITVPRGQGINLQPQGTNLISSSGQEVYTHANLIWDATIDSWVLVSYE